MDGKVRAEFKVVDGDKHYGIHGRVGSGVPDIIVGVLVHHTRQSEDISQKIGRMGGYARFGMDDGYLVGPKEVIFDVLAEFAEGIRRDPGCALNTIKCKMYSQKEGACAAARREGKIPEEVKHI